MGKLESILKRDFPQFQPTQSFEAGIPIYAVTLRVETVEQQSLSSFESYFLQAIDCGIDNPAEIANLLGLYERDLLGVGANLLRLNYIRQELLSENKRIITLTPRGREALSEDNGLLIPKIIPINLHFNALTWNPIPLEKTALSVNEMCKNPYTILPKEKNHLPSLGDFSEKEVTDILRNSQNITITNLIELKKLELQYIAPVTVILLKDKKVNEQRVVIYNRNNGQLKTESDALKHLFKLGAFQFPIDATNLEEKYIDIPLNLPPDVKKIIENIQQNEYNIQKLETDLVDYEERQSNTQNKQEKKALEERIAQLQKELELEQREKVEHSKKAQQRRVKFLKTEEHRDILEKALKEAKKEIIIISPWLNRQTCNDQICQLVGKAINRGVSIRIGYWMGKQYPQTARKNQANVEEVEKAFRNEIQKTNQHLLKMIKTSGTHQKILLCDRIFAVNGSFNWLSYKGSIDEGYRKETSTILYDRQDIDELATIALNTLEIVV